MPDKKLTQKMRQIILKYQPMFFNIITYFYILRNVVSIPKHNRKTITSLKTNTQRIPAAENTPITLFQKMAQKQYKLQEKQNIWKKSPYSVFNNLKIDDSGKVGEKFIQNICIKTNIQSKYTEDINSKDGTYDIKIMGKKCEIKTARQGVNSMFQHDNLSNIGCDFYLFLDISPQKIYITILPKFDLFKKSEIVGKRPHLRKGTTNIFKLDFSIKNIEKMENEGYTLCLDDNTTFEEISEYFKKRLFPGGKDVKI